MVPVATTTFSQVIRTGKVQTDASHRKAGMGTGRRCTAGYNVYLPIPLLSTPALPTPLLLVPFPSSPKYWLDAAHQGSLKLMEAAVCSEPVPQYLPGVSRGGGWGVQFSGMGADG